MNNILTIKIFGDVDQRYGPYFRIGYRDKEATFNLLDKDRQALPNAIVTQELISAMAYLEYKPGSLETSLWLDLCCLSRDLYLEMRQHHE